MWGKPELKLVYAACPKMHHGLDTISKYDAGNTYQRYDHGTKVGETTHSTNVTCTCCHGTGH